jgi:hypothetical protein
MRIGPTEIELKNQEHKSQEQFQSGDAPMCQLHYLFGAFLVCLFTGLSLAILTFARPLKFAWRRSIQQTYSDLLALNNAYSQSKCIATDDPRLAR